MKRQPSPTPIRFLTPPNEDSPPHSPSIGHANVEGENGDIPMASSNHPHKESEDFFTGDAPL